MERYCDMTRCMIIDDDSNLREEVCNYLSEYGFDAVSADDEAQALADCHRQMPDFVMVGTTGAADFVARLRNSEGGDSPIVIVLPETADVSRVGQAIWSGATDYLVKPFGREVLHAKLRQTGLLQNQA